MTDFNFPRHAGEGRHLRDTLDPGLRRDDDTLLVSRSLVNGAK